MLPSKLPKECGRFVVGFIVGFRSDTEGPWWFFITKNIVLIKIFLVKKLR